MDVGIANITWAGAIEPYHVAHEVPGLCLRGVLHAEAHLGLIAHPHVDREDYPPLVNGEQAQILSSFEKRAPRVNFEKVRRQYAAKKYRVDCSTCMRVRIRIRWQTLFIPTVECHSKLHPAGSAPLTLPHFAGGGECQRKPAPKPCAHYQDCYSANIQPAPQLVCCLGTSSK